MAVAARLAVKVAFDLIERAERVDMVVSRAIFGVEVGVLVGVVHKSVLEIAVRRDANRVR